MESVFYGFETLKLNTMIKEENKDLAYWKANAEEDYMQVPISVLRYISELETLVKNCSIPAVSGRSEQLVSFLKWYVKDEMMRKEKELITSIVERYLNETNCH